MIKIDFSNIEDLLFYNQDIIYLFPCKKLLFNNYFLAKRTGNLNKIKEIKAELLNSIDNKDIDVIEKVLGEKVQINKINFSLTKSFDFDSSNFNSVFSEDLSFKDFCIYKNKENISISFWR